MRTITVSNRSVYFKYAEVEVTIPDDIKDEDILDWLTSNEHEFVERIDNAIYKSDYECSDSECEWRYDVEVDGKQTIGGHL